MKRTIPLLMFFVLAGAAALADDVQYDIRVDGITCPFCVAKHFMPRCLHAMKCFDTTGQDVRSASRRMPGSDYPRDETVKPVTVQSMFSEE